MSRLRVGTAAALLAIAALATLTTQVWGTHVVKINSRVSIAEHNLTFHGKVRSPNAGCLAHRRVKLKRHISAGNDQTMGADTTDVHGRWSIHVSGFAGITLNHFYAHLKRRSEGAAGTIFVCRGDRSRTIRPGT
jgi:hypothetical protein